MIAMPTLDFELPAELEAHEPPEARGLRRDQVRLMVSHSAADRIAHTRFDHIGEHLCAGDVLVINTSGTLNAALNVTRTGDKEKFELHLSTHLPSGEWVVEVRAMGEGGTKPHYTAQPGGVYHLPAGATAALIAPYEGSCRLWRARLTLPLPVHAYLDLYGFPIRYRYVPQQWDAAYYQTVYADEPGSAEMPSAGRAFTPELITRLIARGVIIAPLTLHTGVASLEDHEPPYAEPYRVPAVTARLINGAHEAGGRVIAVGTTVVRALETVTGADGIVHPGASWTREVITPQRGVYAVDGLLTGLHEPRATHLAMLEAVADRAHLRRAYDEALREGYRWHEFGDLHLILP